MKKSKLIVTALTCSACGDTIYSRHRHDFRRCSCGRCYIDGGLDYIRVGYDPDMKAPETKEVAIDATRKELYQDWNLGTNEFGRIPREENR